MGLKKGIRQNKISGEDHHLWKGGSIKNSYGYIRIMCKGHPRADRDGYVFEHILIAEKALGKYLPEGIEIHHLDEVKSNNSNSNLIVCQDRSYHRILHSRAKSMKATGRADLHRCSCCGEWKEYKYFGTKGNWFRTACNDCRKHLYIEKRIKDGQHINTWEKLSKLEKDVIRFLYIPKKFGYKKIAKALGRSSRTIAVILKEKNNGA